MRASRGCLCGWGRARLNCISTAKCDRPRSECLVRNITKLWVFIARPVRVNITCVRVRAWERMGGAAHRQSAAAEQISKRRDRVRLGRGVAPAWRNRSSVGVGGMECMRETSRMRLRGVGPWRAVAVLCGARPQIGCSRGPQGVRLAPGFGGWRPGYALGRLIGRSEA